MLTRQEYPLSTSLGTWSAQCLFYYICWTSRTHTVLSCVSAAGYAINGKRADPDNLKEGAVLHTMFQSSKNGWINADIYLEWIKFFVRNIDGHASHVTVEVIQFARANDVHLLCLPAHTTHILHPCSNHSRFFFPKVTSPSTLGSWHNY